MPGDKLPYMKWYPQQCDSDEQVKGMTHEEFGFYVRCLNHAWVNGSIPADIEELARIMSTPFRTVKRIWNKVGKKWIPLPDDSERLVNPYQMMLRQEIENKSEKCRRSVQTRYQNRTNGLRQGYERSQNVDTDSYERTQNERVRAYDSDSVSVSDSQNESVRKPISRELTRNLVEMPRPAVVGNTVVVAKPSPQYTPFDLFEEIWQAYPEIGRTRKSLTRGVFVGKLDQSPYRNSDLNELREKILASLERWKFSDQWQRGAVISIRNWLSEALWEEDPPPTAYIQPSRRSATIFRDRNSQGESPQQFKCARCCDEKTIYNPKYINNMAQLGELLSDKSTALPEDLRIPCPDCGGGKP